MDKIKMIFLALFIIFNTNTSYSTENNERILIKNTLYNTKGTNTLFSENRPVTDTSVVISNGIIRVHYDTSGFNLPDFEISELSSIINTVYDFLKDTIRFNVNLFDNGLGGDSLYDIYIQNLNGMSFSYVYLETSIEEDIYFSYLVIDNDYLETSYILKGIDALKISIAYSLCESVLSSNYVFHSEESYYYFMTGAAIEEFIYNDVNYYYFYLPYYFSNPNKCFTKYGCELSIWNIYLKEKFGLDIIKEIWENAVDYPMLIAIDSTLYRYNTSFAQELNSFGEWTFYTANRSITGKYFKEAINYPKIESTKQLLFVPPDVQDSIVYKPLSNNVILIPDYYSNYNDTLVMIVTNGDIQKAINNSSESGLLNFTIFENTSDTGIVIDSNYRYNLSTDDSTTFIVSTFYFPDTVINEIRNNNILSEYNLYQNYPNPFNSNTTIRYEIPQNACVSIKIFDICGNEIKTLNQGGKNPGSYSYKFDADGLSSGIYLYTVQLDNRITTVKKMVLIK